MKTNLQENNKGNENGYQLVMPIEVGIKIEEDAPVRLLSQICDELNYGELKRAYANSGRKPSSPIRLFKVMVYAYMNGIYSSRAIEKACKRDIHFMWLLEGEKAPDHNTIARFRSKRLSGCMEDLFYQLVTKLADMGEVRFENLFVDGTKIEAKANRYSFVWLKAVEKNTAKLNLKLDELMRHICSEYGIAEDKPAQALCRLQELAKDSGVEFVYGKGTRKQQIQRDYEQLEEYIQRLEKYTASSKVFQGRNSYSKTDTDATFMRMKDDHMKNGQLKPGYNLLIGVEGEYITGVDISSERSDVNALIPLLEKMDKNLGVRHKTLIGDAGFESEENYTYLDKHNQTCFIKPSNYERSKTRKYRNNKYLSANMPYCTETDTFTCPAGKLFHRAYEKIRKSKTGFEAHVTVYECESCEGCEQKALCTKAQQNRKIEISWAFMDYRTKALQNIQSEQGILLRINRSIQVEGAFGVLKQDYGFRRFLLRGKHNVYTESLLMGFSFNINKLHSKMKNHRLGMLLHEKMTA